MDNDVHAIPFLLTEVLAEAELEMPDRIYGCNGLFTPLKILFLNGYGSRPGGINSTILRAHGHNVVEPDLPDNDFARSVSIAQRVFHRHHPDIVAGWSRGGAVAMSLERGNTPLILIAPAWKNWGTITKVQPAVTVLHSTLDDLVPIEDSRQLLRNSNLPQQYLQPVGEDHRMIDEAAFVTLLETVESLGTRSVERRAA